MFLNMYGIIYPMIQRTPGAPRTEFTAVMNTLRKCWHHTSQRFRDLKLRRDDPRYPAYEYWRDLGRRIGIRGSTQPQQNESDDPSETEKKKCNWRDCLCSENNPHHPLRVCKGCWRVLYCGSKCQKK